MKKLKMSLKLYRNQLTTYMSKKQLILIDLLNGKTHTALSIADKFRTTKGNARIAELIKDGFPINITEVKGKRSDYNRYSI
jgi:hypothetical protein